MKLFFCLLFVTTSAFALNLNEKTQMAKWNEHLKGTDGHGPTFKANCGYELPVSFDENMVTPFMAKNSDVATNCDLARSAMADMCKKPIQKAAIAKIKSLHCKLGKEEEVSFKISKTALEFTVGVSAPNIEDKTREFLENNL